MSRFRGRFLIVFRFLFPGDLAFPNFSHILHAATVGGDIGFARRVGEGYGCGIGLCVAVIDGNSLWYAVTKSGDNWDVADTPVANSDITAGYYIYKNIVPTSGTATELPDLFEKLSVDLTPEDGAAITQVDNMDIKACAIQAVGYDMLEGVITTDATNLNQAELNEIMNSLPADFTNPVA